MLTWAERLHSKVDIRPDGCWIWTASVRPSGYGQIWTPTSVDRPRRQLLSAHRAMYELHRGAIPEGLDLDHLCRVRLCVNPEHLEPVTRRENIRRGTAPAAVNARKQRCAAGHELAGCPWPSANGRRCCPCKHGHGSVAAA